MPHDGTGPDEILLGVDCGTESVRVIAVDPAGRVLGSVRTPHPTTHPFTGAAEQAPADWWAGLVAAIRQISADGVPIGRAAAIGITATSSTVVLVDSSGEPVRPALLWMDVRATPEAAALGTTGHPALSICPDGVSPEWGPPKAAWVHANEPDRFPAAHVVCEGGDWLIHRLTGEWTLNVPAAATAWFYDAANRRWPSDLFAAAGMPWLESLLPAILPAPGEIAGALTGAAASALGLPPGIPVVAGGIDSASAMLALGVTRPGPVALITGSSNVLLAMSDRPIRASGVWGSYADAVLPSMELVVGLHGAGSAVAWLTRDLLGGQHKIIDLERDAMAISPGSDGLIALPDFQGNRTPFTEPSARAAYWGLSLGHRPAHLYRATLEGIAYATRHALNPIEAAGAPATELRACGGATRSELTMQIYADVLNRRIVTSETTDASALGAAISAAVGIGVHTDFAAAATAMNRPGRVYSPNEADRTSYDARYELFRRTYPALLPLMREMAEMKASPQ